MTRPDLDALAALLERATPGPWYECSGLVTPSHRLFTETRHENAALIVAAVNALPALIARVRELEQERDEARAERDALREVVRAADAVRTLQFDDLWEVREYDRARAAWKDEV